MPPELMNGGSSKFPGQLLKRTVHLFVLSNVY